MKHELLAPAGNLEAGYAALYYGADAVYLGLTKFSARAGAENFTPEELDEFSAYAHSLGKKVFVALNTLITEAEIPELKETFMVLRRTKVDALIIQDLGVFWLARQYLPEIELHASTQMAVHNLEGARFLASLGFKRVVLARELSLAEIEKIAKALPQVDLEVFVHGALCYSYSGQCLFSALEYGKSANRGRCVYPCRSIFMENRAIARSYRREVPVQLSSRTTMYAAGAGRTCDDSTALYRGFQSQTREELYEAESMGEVLKGHLFSMKDLALEEKVLKIPALSLKIEGRKKSPLYVAAVTNYYRHILDGKKPEATEAQDIQQIFSRPWCNFHFNGKDKTVTDPSFVGHRGLLIGTVERVAKNRLILKTSHAFARYDGVQIDAGAAEKPFGFSVQKLYVNGKSVYEVKKGQTVEIELPDERPQLQLGAKVYLASSSAVKGKYAYDKPKSGAYRNRQELDVVVEVSADKVWALCRETAVSVEGDFQVALDASKTKAAAEAAFAKNGGTGLVVQSLTLNNPDNRFVPMSLLNELRRRLFDMLAENTVEERIEFPVLPAFQAPSEPVEIKSYPLSFTTSEDELKSLNLNEAWLCLPQICRDTARLIPVIETAYRLGARQFVAENWYVFELLKPYPDIKIGAGSFLYILNHYAAAALKELGVVWGMPALESSPDNMAEIVARSPLPMVQLVFGFVPLFTSAVCIRPNSCKDCKRGRQEYQLKKDGKVYRAVSEDCQIQVFKGEGYRRSPIAGIWGKTRYLGR